MARTNKLTLSQIRKQKPGTCLGDGGNLWIRYREDGWRGFCFRYTVRGKAHEMGLGPLEDLDHLADDLTEARDAAREARRLLRTGRDPIAERHGLRAQAEQIQTFETVAREWWQGRIDSKEWTPKHGRNILGALENHAFSKLGHLPVDQITVSTVERTLRPIWTSKTRTAQLTQRTISQVLAAEVARGHLTSNPARWSDNLDAILSKPSKITSTENHSALPFEQIAAFLVELRKVRGISARALEFCILTAARSGEVRGALWSEIDLDAKTWTVPADRMKAGKEHRVPLSDRAVEILESLDRPADCEIVFPSPRTCTPLTDHALLRVLRKFYGPDAATVHGFRATFKTWTSERTSYPREAAEVALAHTVGNAVEQAYNRGDLFSKRAALMADWSIYCQTPVTDAEVVPIAAAR